MMLPDLVPVSVASVKFLLTNDDGIGAPGLLPFAKALAKVSDLAVVVPDSERSWVGKAITRYDPVRVEARTIDGIEIYACSGYPADSVQLGVNSLFEQRPDLVVSGVNIGYNHGAAYLQSSGTAGAALEAAIAGVPAIAFSTGSGDRPWREWKAYANSDDSAAMWQRVGEIAAGLAVELLPLIGPGDVINVGIPDEATAETTRRLTTVAEVGYARLFAEVEPGVFSHSYGALVDVTGIEGTDVEAGREGIISICPVRGAHGVEPRDSLRQLET